MSLTPIRVPDVQMPGADGFDADRHGRPDKMPFVVFVTV